MTKSELKKLIYEKTKERRSLVERAAHCDDVAELRSIKDNLEKLVDEIFGLDCQLEALNDEPETRSEGNFTVPVVPPNAERRGFVPLAAYGAEQRDPATGLRSLGAFAIGGAAGASPAEGLALRSDESMVTRITGDKKPLDIGKYIRGMVTGDWSNALEERAAFTTTAAGVVIPQICAAQIVDRARNISLFASAGVPVIPMPEGNLTIARVKTDPVFSFKAEGDAQENENGFDLEGVELNAKMCYGYATVSLEAIHSAKNLTDIIYQVFSQAMSDCMDRGMLYGQTATPSAAPAGIMNDKSVNTIAATNRGYADFVKAIGAVRRANGTPTVIGINADTEEIFSLMTDTNGQPLNAPKAVDEMVKIVSNQLKEDDASGSDALVFDPMSMVIGMQTNIVVRMFTDSTECIKRGLVGFQIFAMLDCAAVRPTHIAKITGIKAPAAA